MGQVLLDICIQPLLYGKLLSKSFRKKSRKQKRSTITQLMMLTRFFKCFSSALSAHKDIYQKNFFPSGDGKSYKTFRTENRKKEVLAPIFHKITLWPHELKAYMLIHTTFALDVHDQRTYRE